MSIFKLMRSLYPKRKKNSYHHKLVQQNLKKKLEKRKKQKIPQDTCFNESYND